VGEGGVFSTEVALQPGENLILVTAKGARGVNTVGPVVIYEPEAPVAAPGPAQGPSAAPPPVVTLGGRPRVRRHSVALSVSCSSACEGELLLAIGGRRAGRNSVKLAAGQRRTYLVALDSRNDRHRLGVILFHTATETVTLGSIQF
jgi:hypothetical protein